MKTLKVISLSLLVLLSTSGVTMTKNQCQNMPLETTLLTQADESSNSDMPSGDICYTYVNHVFLVTLHEFSVSNLVPVTSKHRIWWFVPFQQLRLQSINFKPQLFLASSRPFYKPKTFIQIQSFLL